MRCARFFVLCVSILTLSNLKKHTLKKADCNVHPQDNEATAAARIARCAPSLGPAALTAIDRATPVVEPPDLLARRVANAAAAAAAAAGAGGGVGGGGNAEPVAGPGA